MVDFSAMSKADLKAMAAAGREVAECYRVLRKSGDNVVGELLRGEEGFYEWNHYPKGDVYDRDTHSQFFYHAHPQTQRSGEHGHFHTFIRANGIPKAISPVALPDYQKPENRNDDLCHLIAISMDRQGYPIRLFTTNRWVTGETWYDAESVCKLLRRYKIDHARPSWPVNRWVTAMVRLFEPQIKDLVRQRDLAIDAWTKDKAPDNIYEDRALEITSYLDISVEDQMSEIQQAL